MLTRSIPSPVARSQNIIPHEPREMLPIPDNSLKLRQAIGQGGRAGLQNQRRFDLVHVLALHSRYSIEARPRCNSLRPEFLAAPRADDQIGFPLDDLLNRHNAVLGSALVSAIGENVDAAGYLDELRNPSNSGDQRIIPLLEKHLWPLRQACGPLASFGQTGFESFDKLLGPLARAHHCPEHADHIEDPGDSALVEGVHLDPAANEIGDDVRLEVGERQNQIRLQREDLADVRGRESAYPRLLVASQRRAHHVARDADDAVLLAEQVERLDRLFGEADKSARGEHQTVAYPSSRTPGFQLPPAETQSIPKMSKQ